MLPLPDLAYLALPDGMLFQVNKEITSAQATAGRMGMLADLNSDLNRAGGEVKVAAAIGKDGAWLRAVIASNAPAITGFAWMEFAVSPVNRTAADWLIALVSVMSHEDPNEVRIVGGSTS